MSTKDDRPAIVNGERRYYPPEEPPAAQPSRAQVEPTVDVVHLHGGGIMAYRYGVDFRASATAYGVPVTVANAMAREFPKDFAIKDRRTAPPPADAPAPSAPAPAPAPATTTTDKPAARPAPTKE